jgi:N-acyl-L-homoserine lactone synthetase
MIEDGLYSYLIARPAIKAIIGNRLYPDRLPQEPTLPALVYNNVGGAPVDHHSGPAVLESTRFQIDAFAKTSRDARMLIDAVRLALESYRGSMGTHRVDTILVLEHAVGDFDDIPDDFRRMSEFMIWHSL